MARAVVGVSFQNAAEFKAQLAVMTEQARQEVAEQAALAGAEQFLAAAKANAPVLKKDDPRRVRGNLRDKIAKMVLSRKPGVVTVGVGIGKEDMRAKVNGAFYALMVEYGTRFMAAIPFLRPAFDVKKDAAAQDTIGSFKGWLRVWGAA